MKETTLLFLRRDDEILLAMKKRRFGEGRWNGVGGKVAGEESIEDTLLREAQEEIGITPTTFSKVADISFDQYFKGEHALMHANVFIATDWEGVPTESEEMKPQWFPIDTLPYDAMWQDDPYWLPLVLKGKKIEASFVMDQNDVITEHTIQEVDGFH
jgi:8-oxo-dGTP pyrophosphatase MutT (NUDIX family)